MDDGEVSDFSFYMLALLWSPFAVAVATASKNSKVMKPL
jgi:hypothetical protein